jgi:c-di-AMP phosphodiesterase-like protein
MSLEMKLKRGEKSWAFFPLAYSILLTISTSIISVLPDFTCSWLVKITLIFFVSIFFYKLCFYNDWFRNKIVGIFSKSQEKIETYIKNDH